MARSELRPMSEVPRRLVKFAFFALICLISLQRSAIGFGIGEISMTPSDPSPGGEIGRTSFALTKIACSDIAPGPCNGPLVFAFITPPLTEFDSIKAIEARFGSCSIGATEIDKLDFAQLKCLKDELTAQLLFDENTEDLNGFLVDIVNCTTCGTESEFEETAIFEVDLYYSNSNPIPIGRLIVTTSDALGPDCSSFPQACFSHEAVGSCVDQSTDCCESPIDASSCEGQFSQKTLCGPNDPACAIPAASEWGLVVIALIGLVMGTVVFGRTYRPSRA